MSFLEAVFSENTLVAIFRMAPPLIFIAMAACIGRKANITSIAYEGMALFAALCGALGSHYTNSLWLGALIGIATGMLIAVIFAYFVLYLDTSPMLIGLALSLLWGTWADRTQQELSEKVLRLHVLANSDSAEDQALKLKVRDSVVEKAAEILAGCHDRESAEQRLTEALPELEEAARKRIAAEGESQRVTAELRPTRFPTREYESFTLPAGEYLALRVVIGQGAGHNWWCVVFPPLCAETTSDLAETAMAAGLTSFWIEPCLLYRHGFGSTGLWGYFARYAAYAAATAGGCLLTGWIAARIPGAGIPAFLGKMAVCALVPNALFWLCFGRTAAFALIHTKVQKFLCGKRRARRQAP